MNLTSSTGFLNHTRRCPGINRGRNYTADQIDEIQNKSSC
jgi:hypothetical protein